MEKHKALYSELGAKNTIRYPVYSVFISDGFKYPLNGVFIMSNLSDNQQQARLTPAERQRRRRARLPRRIDYYPGEEALVRIEAMQQEQYRKAGKVIGEGVLKV